MKKFNFIEKFKNNLKNLFLTNKKLFFTSVFAVVALVCVAVFSFVSDKKTTEVKDKNISEISISDYSQKIENKIIDMLSKIDEVKSVSAFVMVDSTPLVKYLTEVEETQTPSDKGTHVSKTETVVFEKNGSSSTPIVVATSAPKISGVLIVVNKIQASTKLSIINSVSIVLNVPESCITILQEQ